jgi:murein DD-endopeptidase MepM/ murein hydrolase activator NlpD
MRKLIVLLFSVGLLCGVWITAAQEATHVPEGEGALDEVVGTPQPLPTRQPQPVPSQVIGGERASLVLYFPNLPQGSVGLVQVEGDSVTGATATWLNRLIDFFPVEGQGWFGLLSVGMEQNPRRDYPLQVAVLRSDGTREILAAQVEVVLGGFIRREVILTHDKGYLLDAESERAELARLESIFALITPIRMWDETGFQLPIAAALTSPFGEFRVFNGTLNTRHTGWDIRCTIGTPVFASARGRVVFAGVMPIRGNHIVIDHGLGVFSGYSHLSVINVTRGQDIEKDQDIGMTGNGGRTSGPHFHWEMAVNGEWVDSVQFLRMWMP